jgi:hypothetical protein
MLKSEADRLLEDSCWDTKKDIEELTKERKKKKLCSSYIRIGEGDYFCQKSKWHKGKHTHSGIDPIHNLHNLKFSGKYSAFSINWTIKKVNSSSKKEKK